MVSHQCSGFRWFPNGFPRWCPWVSQCSTLVPAYHPQPPAPLRRWPELLRLPGRRAERSRALHAIGDSAVTGWPPWGLVQVGTLITRRRRWDVDCLLSCNYCVWLFFSVRLKASSRLLHVGVLGCCWLVVLGCCSGLAGLLLNASNAVKWSCSPWLALGQVNESCRLDQRKITRADYPAAMSQSRSCLFGGSLPVNHLE